jgi:hypothetical protein
VYLLGPKAHAALRLRSILDDELLGRRPPSVPLASIPYQLAVNRVGDALGTSAGRARVPRQERLQLRTFSEIKTDPVLKPGPQPAAALRDDPVPFG